MAEQFEIAIGPTCEVACASGSQSLYPLYPEAFPRLYYFNFCTSPVLINTVSGSSIGQRIYF
jgi:hypothetical protein